MCKPIFLASTNRLTTIEGQIYLSTLWEIQVKNHVKAMSVELRSLLSKYYNYNYSLSFRGKPNYGARGLTWAVPKFELYLSSKCDSVVVIDTNIRNPKDLDNLLDNIKKRLNSRRIFKLEMEEGLDNKPF